MPEVVAERHLVLRLRVERRRQRALDAEERLEHLPDRLPEALGGILHARRLQREAAIPCGPLAQASMILAVHDLDRQQHDSDDDQQEDDRAVTRPVGIHRREQQPAFAMPAYR